MEVEIRYILRAVRICFVIVARHAAAVFDAIGQALVVRGLRPAFVDNAVAEGVLAPFGPGCDGGCSVVGVIVNVADFSVTFGIWFRQSSG